MTAITISRQLGSWGDEVAQAIAERLDFQVTCRELINQAARQARAPEMALAQIDDLGLFGLHPSTKTRRSFHDAIQTLMHEAADRGNIVIIGRAGQVILHNSPNVLHVKVIAPADLRAQRLSDKLNIPIEAASAQISASDRARRNYLRRYYNARWDDPELYDVIVNTARLSPDQAACLICQAMSQCIQPTTHASAERETSDPCHSK